MLSGVHVGISSLGVPLTDLLAREGTEHLPQAMQAWAAARHLDVLVVMTSFTGPQGSYSRELGLWAATPAAEAILPALVRFHAAPIRHCRPSHACVLC
jgi:hypothetical protein